MKTSRYLTFAAAALLLMGVVAWGAHNTLTVKDLSLSDKTMSGTVSVKNLIGAAQIGDVTVTIFQVDPFGKVVQLVSGTLGSLSLEGNTSQDMPFDMAVPVLGESVFSMYSSATLPLKGTFVVLATWQTSIGGNLVAHSHSGALSMTVE